MHEDDLLNQALESESSQPFAHTKGQPPGMGSPEITMPAPPSPASDFCQWGVMANDSYRATGGTRTALPAGVYQFDNDNYGIYLQKVAVINDSLIPLPDSANERVLAGMRKFWMMQDTYRAHGLLYKRGILLWGPPGSGKTATLKLLIDELIANNGLVIFCRHPRLTSDGLSQLRRIEPSRRLICILEDIDELMAVYGEHDLLALLDGENQVDNIVMLATTNYPDRLGARIVNRPARFDERILVGMPSWEARAVYLGHVAGKLSRADRERWVTDTDGLSIAHLRELAAAVLCLEQPYEDVIRRLRSMRILPKERDGMVGNGVGFGN